MNKTSLCVLRSKCPPELARRSCTTWYRTRMQRESRPVGADVQARVCHRIVNSQIFSFRSSCECISYLISTLQTPFRHVAIFPTHHHPQLSPPGGGGGERLECLHCHTTTSPIISSLVASSCIPSSPPHPHPLGPYP